MKKIILFLMCVLMGSQLVFAESIREKLRQIQQKEREEKARGTVTSEVKNKTEKTSTLEKGQCQRSADCPKVLPKTKFVDCREGQCVEFQCRHDLDCKPEPGSLFRCEEGVCRDKNDIASLPVLTECVQTSCDGCKLGHYKIYSKLGKALCVECSANMDCLPDNQCQAYRCVPQ